MILKKGTQVKVIAGKDKGKTGEILEINRKLKKVKIKSIDTQDLAKTQEVQYIPEYDIGTPAKSKQMIETIVRLNTQQKTNSNEEEIGTPAVKYKDQKLIQALSDV